MKNNLGAMMFALLAAVFPVTASSAVSTSANYKITADVINSGVGDMSSVSFKLASSVGDAVLGANIASSSFKLASGFRAEISVPPAVLNLLSVFSRKMHGGLPFDLQVNDQPLTGLITVEPRAISGGHKVYFSFDNPVNAGVAATALDEAMNSAATVTLARVGNDVIATLTNVTDNKRLKITLTGVNTLTATPIERSVGFLVGDVNGSYSVNAADISAVKAHLNQQVNSIGVAKFDLNADGSITQADVSLAKARSGKILP